MKNIPKLEETNLGLPHKSGPGTELERHFSSRCSIYQLFILMKTEFATIARHTTAQATVGFLPSLDMELAETRLGSPPVLILYCRWVT